MSDLADWMGTLDGNATTIEWGRDTAYKLQGIVGWFDYTASPFGGAQVSSGTIPAPKPYANGAWAVPYWVPTRDVTIALQITGRPARGGTDAVTTTTTIQIPSGTFGRGDIGRPITLAGVGAAGVDLVTTVATVITSTQITVATAPSRARTAVAWSMPEVPFTTLVDAFRAATIPDGTQKSLTAHIDGVASTVTGAITTRGIPTDLAYQSGLAIATATLELTDVRRLGETQQSTVTVPAGGVSTATPALANDGNVPGPVVVSLTGPITTPTVICGGATVAFTSGFAIAGGDVVVLDMEARSATLVSTGASVAGSIATRNWFGIPPGGAPVSIDYDTAGYGAQMAVSYRSAWI